MLTLLFACSPDGTGKVDDVTPPDDTGLPLHETGTETDTDTPVDTNETGTAVVHTGTEPVPAQISCAGGANPLVFRCTVTLGRPGPATLVVSAAGADTRTFVDDDEELVHEIVAWGLLPDTTFDVSAEGAATTVTSGSLPTQLANATFRTNGTMFGIDAVLVYVHCGYFVMVDGQGRVVWYLETDVYDSFSDGMRWSQRTKSMLASTDSTMSRDQSEFLDVDLEWGTRSQLTTADFDLKLTHDLDTWGGYTYLLGETNSGMGGFEVFDGATKLGQWLLDDGFAGTNGLGNAHVNGLSVTDVGEVVISSLNFDAAIGVDGDPASPTFLEMQWHAGGQPGGGSDLPSPDLVPDPAPGWDGQHNISRVGDDLWVFDNRSEGDARAVRFAMDFVAGTLTEVDSWDTRSRCSNQGGALVVPGGALVTCANSDDVMLFRDGIDTPDWTVQPACGRDGGASTRAYAVTIE